MTLDAVIPVPDTSRTAAIQVAYHLGVKFREGFIKNRYIGRTFIMPGQAIRKKSVRQKLNPSHWSLRIKPFYSSMIRLFAEPLVARLFVWPESREPKVYFASAAPPIRYPNVYGIDMPAVDELIASSRTVEEVEKQIGADWLIYQDLADLHEVV